jgi:hypothetical protein
MKLLKTAAPRAEHKFCGHCGGEMVTVQDTATTGYDRATGKPIYAVRARRECSNSTKGGAHDLIA